MSGAITIKVPSSRCRFVAIKPDKDHTVVACGNSRKTVLSKAKKAGVEDPAIMYVPDPRKRYIY